MSDIVKTGLLLACMAVASLACGGIAGLTCAKASSGFATNLRHDLFAKVQTYSFENIDKFSSSSLVTRLTTDVSNVQMAYMMIIRTAIRAPLMLIFSVIMAYAMGGNALRYNHSRARRGTAYNREKGNACVPQRFQEIRPPERVD